MFYYKKRVIFTRVLFCLFFLNAPILLSYAKEDTVDLGETGFSSPIQFTETGKDYAKQGTFRNILQII